jgi:hypothetical protein
MRFLLNKEYHIYSAITNHKNKSRNDYTLNILHLNTKIMQVSGGIECADESLLMIGRMKTYGSKFNVVWRH